MYYSIWRNNILVANVKPLDSSELSQKAQTEDVIRLNFRLNAYINLMIGDYIIFEKNSQIYRLNKYPRVVESPMNYQYECLFEGGLHEIEKTKVFLLTEKTSGGYYRDYNFSLSGNAKTFLDFIVENLNRNGGSFVAGTYKSTDYFNIEFNNWNVLEAINEISSTIGFSWYLNNNILNFDSPNEETNYILQVGRKVGLTELIQQRVDSEKISTIVYGYGSSKNMPPRTGTGTTFDSETLNDNVLCFEGVDDISKLENNKELYGNIENVQVFDDIYPTRTGTVTAISSNLRLFYDSSMDFDINYYLLSSITPKVTFLTGKLMGLTFNVSYNASSKCFTMDYYTDESGQYPNSLIYADIGDTYKIYDICFPESYLTEAQERLEEATQEYLTKYSKPMCYYEATLDSEYIRTHNIVLSLGNLVRIVSPAFQIDNLYEIKELTQSLTNPYKYSIKFGDVLSKGLLSLLKTVNFNTQKSIYSIQNSQVTNNQVTNILGQDLQWQDL